jgi:hypothetical protein
MDIYIAKDIAHAYNIPVLDRQSVISWCNRLNRTARNDHDDFSHTDVVIKVVFPFLSE